MIYGFSQKFRLFNQYGIRRFIVIPCPGMRGINDDSLALDDTFFDGNLNTLSDEQVQ